MMTILTRLVLVVVLFDFTNTDTAVDAPGDGGDAEAVTRQFYIAFTNADIDKMTEHFADEILYDGDPRFVGRDNLENPAELTKRRLSDAYAKLIERVGREKWTEQLQKTKPTLTESTIDGKPIKLAKKGDYVYDLHFREAIKGKRAGLDQAVIFVFRKVDDKYRIVAHFADY